MAIAFSGVWQFLRVDAAWGSQWRGRHRERGSARAKLVGRGISSAALIIHRVGFEIFQVAVGQGRFVRGC
jgi:hypothetical protein